MKMLSYKKKIRPEKFRKNRQKQERIRKHENHRKSVGLNPVTFEKVENLRTAHIEAPAVFSLMDHPEQAIAFFNQIWDNLDQEAIYIDMSKINSITPESILYLRSILDILRQRRARNQNLKRLRGNYPDLAECKDLLCVSGFTEYIKTSEKNRKTSPDILKIMDGFKPEPTMVNQIVEFIANKKNIKRDQAMKNTYATLMECAGNTNEHAYNDMHTFMKKWWGMAYLADNKIKVSILDNGVGIAATMKKNRREAIAEWVKKYKIPIGRIPEHEITLNAFTKSNKSRMNLSYRGKGLPKIYEHVLNGTLDNLFVISNKSFLDLSNEENNRDLEFGLRGTLFSFEIASK
jgi:hypothetical protein